MRIKRLSTTQYRNLVHEPIDFAPGVNVFVGPNGHGKTNVLEAIHFFKFGRSFRAGRDAEVIRFNEPFCRVEVELEYEQGDVGRLAVSIERDGTKKVKIDGKDSPRLSDLVGRYPCVLFGPHDLELTTGAPAERRRFLDMTGSMTDPTYLDELKAYKRVLTQRNAALKRGDAARALGVWAEELIARGCALVERRQILTSALRDYLVQHAGNLGLDYPVEMAYESELLSGRPDEVSCADHFAARLLARESEELRRRTTLVGPHRDDVRLEARERDLRKYGSQGQRRLVAVLLRLAELSYLEEKLGERCVLLLDDLFSELDESISEKLKQHVQDGHQVFVTTPVESPWQGDAQQHNVLDGEIRT